ncbi:MAG: hypothetical protein LAP13_10655 [Acidobacteriia bacterium]|nr:hypothetical protein [Terriglobia bacterium]
MAAFAFPFQEMTAPGVSDAATDAHGPSVASASYPRAVNEYVAFSFSGSFGRQSVLALFRSTDRQGFYARHAKQELGGEKIGFNSDRTDDNSHSWR